MSAKYKSLPENRFENSLAERGSRLAQITVHPLLDIVPLLKRSMVMDDIIMIGGVESETSNPFCSVGTCLDQKNSDI